MTGLAQEHISVTKGSEESPAQVHKQSLNLCGTVFLSTSLCVCVRVFFFCKTSAKIVSFGLAPLASVNFVYLALWCLQEFNQIACVKQSTFLSAPRHRSSADLTLCLTPVVVIYIKMSPHRREGSITELLIANEMLAAKFSETCILKYFDTMTNFPNT